MGTDTARPSSFGEKFGWAVGPGLQVVMLIAAVSVGWGMMRTTISEAKAETQKVQDEIHSVAQDHATLGTRVALLESHRQVTDEKLNQISQSLHDIDIVTRALHDNVLVLCQMSPKGDRCKP